MRNLLGPVKFKVDPQYGVESRSSQLLGNGQIYYGQWIEGTKIRQGFGRLIWQDGSLYEGQFKNNKACGMGRLIHSNGDVYEGQWFNNMADGYGTFVHFQGAIYNG